MTLASSGISYPCHRLTVCRRSSPATTLEPAEEVQCKNTHSATPLRFNSGFRFFFVVFFTSSITRCLVGLVYLAIWAGAYYTLLLSPELLVVFAIFSKILGKRKRWTLLFSLLYSLISFGSEDWNGHVTLLKLCRHKFVWANVLNPYPFKNPIMDYIQQQ